MRYCCIPFAHRIPASPSGSKVTIRWARVLNGTPVLVEMSILGIDLPPSHYTPHVKYLQYLLTNLEKDAKLCLETFLRRNL